MILTIPKTGLYRIECSGVRAIPTGEYYEIKNPHRWFFQFWKPRTVTRERYRFEPMNATEVRFLTEGENIESPSLERITT